MRRARLPGSRAPGVPGSAPARPTGLARVRRDVERATGVPLDDVRVHSDTAAHALARSAGARALTIGRDIYFGAGQLEPEGGAGRRLLAHELAHAASQPRARAGTAEPWRLASPGAGAEREADAVAATVMHGRGTRHALTSQPLTLQCEDDPAASRGLLDGLAVIAAIAWNNRRWSPPYRAELLGFLRASPAAGPDEDYFTREDIHWVARVQARAGITVDGKIGPATSAAILQMGAREKGKSAPAFRFGAHEHSAAAVTLLFYPGDLEDLEAWRKLHDKYADDYVAALESHEVPAGVGNLYVRVGRNLVAHYQARGGPPLSFRDGGHTAGPTPAGSYALGSSEPHTTSAWRTSKLPWGATVSRGSDGEFYWRSIDEMARGVPESRAHKATGTGSAGLLQEDFIQGGAYRAEAFPVWKLNDFGPAAWNLRRAPKGGTPYYLHTTPDNEGGSSYLSTSHGCIHIRPADRDDLLARGFLHPGVRLVVMRYDQHLLSELVRQRTLHPTRP